MSTYCDYAANDFAEIGSSVACHPFPQLFVWIVIRSSAGYLRLMTLTNLLPTTVRYRSLRSCIWLMAVSATLGACVTASQQLREPQILSGSDTAVAIVSAPDMRPKPLAQAHCAQYQKRAVLRDVDRIGESVATRWGNRAYVVHFDCM